VVPRRPFSTRLLAVTIGSWGGACLLVLVMRIITPGLPQGSMPASIAVCFVPAERCASRVVAAIDGAQTEIRVQAYGFTSTPICDALLQAKQRGVDGALLLDKSNLWQIETCAPAMARASTPIWIDRVSGIAHNKVIVIDRRLVIGGSMNYSRSGDTRNVENVTFTRSPRLAGLFLANWSARQARSSAYTSRD
jgi:phospholipase D